MRKTLVTIALGALMALGSATPALANHASLPTDAFQAACAHFDLEQHYCPPLED